MRLIFMRHGDASEPRLLPDECRHLTQPGRHITKRSIAKMVELGHKATHMYTSPLVRAVQSAEMVAQEMGFEKAIGVHTILLPDNAKPRIKDLIKKHHPRDCIYLIGSEPGLSTMIAELTNMAGFDEIEASGCLLVDVNVRGTGKMLGRLDPTSCEWLEGDDHRM